MKTKICGIRSYEDAMTAIDAGADAVGFLVGITHTAEDKITKEEARSVIKKIPPFVSSVMVTHLTNPDEIIKLANYLGVNVVQIHDYIPPEAVRIVHRGLPHCKIIKAIHILDEETALNLLRDFEAECDAVLLDSRTEDRLGGTGLVHDWRISKKIVQNSSTPVILAGGLTPENVFDAVLTVRPYAVDVNSGVETDGYKNHDKVFRFVETAKKAGRKEL